MNFRSLFRCNLLTPSKIACFRIPSTSICHINKLPVFATSRTFIPNNHYTRWPCFDKSYNSSWFVSGTSSNILKMTLHRTFHSSSKSKAHLLNIKLIQLTSKRLMSTIRKKNNTSAVIYLTSILIFMVGMAYAGVPLYKVFCQATGLGGQAVAGHDSTAVADMIAVKDRVIQVRFNADRASSMQWEFRPQQSEVKVVPGETALAFYTATNPTDKPIIGISTYNVIPFEAGQYFNKIQCFCFEEQRLNPNEQVDMPVFFYIDPEFAEDPKMELVNTITLSYTFFEAKDGMSLPLPGYPSRAIAQ